MIDEIFDSIIISNTDVDYSNKELYPHGKCIGIRQNEPYHDVYIYEDGFEEWVQIGD